MLDAGALFASIISLGALPGALGGGWLGDHLGRRFALALFSLPGVLGWVAIAIARPWGGAGSATALVVCCAGRFATGISIGGHSSLVPVFIAEVAAASERGMMGTLNQLSIAIGVAAGFIFGAAFGGSALGCVVCGWRTTAWIGVLPPTLLAVGMFLLPGVPETPRWLLSHGHLPQATASLRWLRGNGDGAQGAAVAAELGQISDDVDRQAAAERQAGGRGGSWAAVLAPAMRRRTAIGCWMQIFVQVWHTSEHQLIYSMEYSILCDFCGCTHCFGWWAMERRAVCCTCRSSQAST
eukprot:SAG11_NODE_3465_length_2431_cov_1.608919_2_plen_296_part_00